MFNKEWKVSFEGTEIIVTNSWSFSGETGAKLYINGSKVDDTDQKIVSKKTPILRGAFESPTGELFKVEVFMKALFSVKVKICVNGVRIGGDEF